MDTDLPGSTSDWWSVVGKETGRHDSQDGVEDGQEHDDIVRLG